MFYNGISFNVQVQQLNYVRQLSQANHGLNGHCDSYLILKNDLKVGLLFLEFLLINIFFTDKYAVKLWNSTPG